MKENHLHRHLQDPLFEWLKHLILQLGHHQTSTTVHGISKGSQMDEELLCHRFMAEQCLKPISRENYWRVRGVRKCCKCLWASQHQEGSGSGDYHAPQEYGTEEREREAVQ
jgi:hypothetical protein